MLFFLLADVVASYNPMTTFLIYAIGVIPFLLRLFFLPESPKTSASDEAAPIDASDAEEKAGSAKPKIALPHDVVILAISLFIMGVAFCPSLIGMSSVVAEKGLGDSSFSGVVLAANSVGGILAGVAMSLYMRVFKHYSLPVTYLALAVSLVLLYAAGNQVLVVTISVFAGFFFALPVSICNLPLGNMVRSEQVAFLSNAIFVMFNLGSFIYSFWITLLGIIVSGMSLVLIAGAVVMVALAIIVGIMENRNMLIGNPPMGEIAT